MRCLLHWGSGVSAVSGRVRAARPGRYRPARAMVVGWCASGGSAGGGRLEYAGQHAHVAPECGRGFGKQGGSGTGGVLAGQFLRANKGGAGQVKRRCSILDVMVNAGDERGVGHGQVFAVGGVTRRAGAAR